MSDSLPVTLCRCCRTPMDAYMQPALGRNKPAQPYVTCWNRDCGMYGQTINAADYPTLDLAKYGATECLSDDDLWAIYEAIVAEDARLEALRQAGDAKFQAAFQIAAAHVDPLDDLEGFMAELLRVYSTLE